jgi:soluble lytic murein transglycosylase-like protein
LPRRLLVVLIVIVSAGVSLLASQGFGGSKARNVKPAGTVVALSAAGTADIRDPFIPKRPLLDSAATTTSSTSTTEVPHVIPPTSVTNSQVKAVVAAPPRVVATVPVTAAPKLSGLPPIFQCIIQHESGGNPRAINRSSGAAGLFQFLPSTWHSLGYSGSAADYPASVQYQAAERLYAQSGTRPWAGDGCV